MIFIPHVDITRVPRDSKSFSFIDDTPDAPGNPTGWGGDIGPEDASDITTMHAEIQPLGEEPTRATSILGTLSGTVQVYGSIPDGVNNLYIHYGQNSTVSGGFTVASDRKSITFLTFDEEDIEELLGGVTGINVNGDFPVKIDSIDGLVVTLISELGGTASTYSGLFRYYTATEQILVGNAAEALIVNKIVTTPLQVKKCTYSVEVMNLITLKMAAVRAFACCNSALAHETQRLLVGQKPFVSTENCSTCG